MARITSLDARFLMAFAMVMATGYPGNEAEWKTGNTGCSLKKTVQNYNVTGQIITGLVFSFMFIY